MPRKPKTAKGQSEPIGFSYHTPQQASSVCLSNKHWHNTLLLTLIELWVSFIYFAQNVFAEDYTADRDFRSPGEMYDEDEQDEVDFYKLVLISL